MDGGFSLDNDAEEALRAPSGVALTFAYEGDRLDSLDTTASSVDGRAQEDLRTRLSGTRARVVADLPPGEYLIEAFATMPEGDATYGFQLVVEG